MTPILDLFHTAHHLLRAPGTFYMNREVWNRLRLILPRRRRAKRRARYTRNRGFVRPRLRAKR